MFWKDLSWEVQTEAMGHSYHTASLSFLAPRVFEGTLSSHFSQMSVAFAPGKR